MRIEPLENGGVNVLPGPAPILYLIFEAEAEPVIIWGTRDEQARARIFLGLSEAWKTLLLNAVEADLTPRPDDPR